MSGSIRFSSLLLKDCATDVLTIREKDMRKVEKVKYSASRDGDRAIFDIVCNLSRQKNGEKFKRLYYSGDYSDYGSHLEVDLALCTLFAFRTGPDPELIHELFRSFALMRDKWEREDYRTASV